MQARMMPSMMKIGDKPQTVEKNTEAAEITVAIMLAAKKQTRTLTISVHRGLRSGFTNSKRNV